MNIGGPMTMPSERFPRVPLSGSLWVNARSAFAAVAREVGGRVWLPAYGCPAMRAELPIWYDGIPTPEPGDIVLFVDYFGFPAPREAMRAARARGAFVVEDASQAFLTEGVGEEADAVIFSPRKFVGVPDGGILISPLSVPKPPPPPAEWLARAIECRTSGTFELFQSVEESAPTGNYAMSDVSRELLECGFDYAAVAGRRRENYLALLDGLREIALYPELSEGVVPLGFPIRLRDRDRVRGGLIAAGIFPPIHWAIADYVPRSFGDSHALSAEILTLPCDQRYDAGDMERIVRQVRRAGRGVKESSGRRPDSPAWTKQ